MDVLITEWGLQSYLDLKHSRVFTVQEYRTVIRPDVELLKGGFSPPAPKLTNGQFWGPATDKTGVPIQHGFKMKWRNVGSGLVQLRLCVAVVRDEALLCHAYVKDSVATDKRQMALFKQRINQIARGQHTVRGKL